ncbi:major tail protein [Bacillus sp. mrc49]|uniref:major tail protein n=1 Tax=Bacillus sp. mrc49 TaxID=2054913 RepID=UPI000C273109|nr:major tail protein [Bacillus sp. mrc49]PJN91406.1 phage tail protein [Bacillus sp. mrc49]
MGIRVGFKRATVGVLDVNGKVTKDVFVIEGKTNKGGTKEATISGISPESIKSFASNVAYYVNAKGTGDVKAELSILDVPEEMAVAVLGRKKHTDGFTLIGERTEAPYVAVLLESEDATGQPVFFALLKGKMSAGDVSLKTSENKPVEPDDEKLTMECVSNNDGETIAYGIGSELAAKLKTYTFPPATPPAG